MAEDNIEVKIDDALEDQHEDLAEIDQVEIKVEQTEKSGTDEAKQRIQQLKAVKEALQKNVTKSLMTAVSDKAITPTDATIALEAYEKAYAELGESSSATDINNAIKELQSKYGDQMKTLDTLLKNSSWRITNAFRRLAPRYEIRNKVALDQLGEKLGQQANEGKIDQATLDNFKAEVDKSSEAIDKDLPDVKEKVESKTGEKGWKAFKLLLLIGTLLGSLLLVAHFLQEKYDGCYLMITKGDSRKLTCGVDQDHCGCGDSDATRNLDTATDAICAKYGDYPFCKGGCRGNPTCSSIDKMVEEGGKNYTWQSYTPFDALLTGMSNGVKELSDDLGLSGIWKYVKYFVYGILALIALIFVIWIVYEIWEHLPKKKTDVDTHESSSSTQ